MGFVRTENQDAYGIDLIRGALVVCDGVGGSPSGGDAARAAVDGFLEMAGMGGSIEVSLAAAEGSVAVASRHFHPRMATTLVGAMPIGPNVIRVGWVGDSRAYFGRGRGVTLVTMDQSVRDGRLANCLGAGAPGALGAEYVDLKVQPRDVLLLCTDGVYGAISESELHALLTSGRSARRIASDCVLAALRNGSDDNVTAVVAIV